MAADQGAIVSDTIAVTTSSAILGQTLIAIRKSKGMTQGEVAEAMGMSASNWSRAEKGESSLTVDQLRSVAKVLGTTPEAILRAADVAEQEAEKKGIKIIVGTVSSAAIGAAVSAGAAGGVAGGAAMGATAGVAIPVIGPILGGLIGAAIFAYLANQKK